MSQADRQLLTFKEQGKIVIGTVRFASVLSATNVAEFGSEVLDYIQTRPNLNLLLNFEHVDYLSSAVLTELLRINKALEESKGRMRLCAIAPTIKEIFEITNLDQVFTLDSDSLEVSCQRFARAIDIADEEAAWQDPREAN